MMSTPTALVFAVPASSSNPRRTTVLGLSASVSPGLPAFVAVGVFCAALMVVFAAAGCLAWWYPRCEDPRSLWWRTLLTALVALAAMVVSGSALSAGWAGLVVSAVVVVLLAAALTVARWLSQQRNRAGKGSAVMSDDYPYAELAAVPIDLRSGDGQTEQDGAPDDDR